jgi:hypothetical protein
MGNAATRIRIEHTPAVQLVETVRQNEPQHLTLLELVEALCEITSDEREVVATALYMLRSGRVRLTGNFHDKRLDDPLY